MKALKERRTSLRSLVRRGLVILSLFALVFAVSCGGSEGSSSSPGEGGEDLPVTTRKVTEMRILKSPTIYSFQGLAPDLTGLVVEVKWSDGTTYEQITDTTQFYTVPPVLETVGYRVGNIALFHNSNKELYADITLPYVAPIYTIDITGKGLANETIYEDEGVNTTGMTLNARYYPIPEVDEGSYRWDGVATETIRQLPVYSDAYRWDFVTGANAKVAYYTAVQGYTWDDDDDGTADKVEVAKQAPFQFDNYYRVDKITLNNPGTFPKFAADDPVYVNPQGPDAAANAWLDLLEDAGVTFDVTYYDCPTVKTRTMADYKRAYTMTTGRKASYPVLSYDDFVDALADGLGINVFLQYYDKNINAVTGAPTDTRPKPNQMMVTFPPESILEYTGVAVEWKLSVPEYNAQVIAPDGKKDDLIEALGTYYDVFRVYSNTAGDEVRIKLPFDTDGANVLTNRTDDDDTYSWGSGWGSFTFNDFTNENDGNTEIMPNNPLTMLVPNPRSLNNGVGTDFDYTFMYDIHPPTGPATP